MPVSALCQPRPRGIFSPACATRPGSRIQSQSYFSSHHDNRDSLRQRDDSTTMHVIEGRLVAQSPNCVYRSCRQRTPCLSCRMLARFAVSCCRIGRKVDKWGSRLWDVLHARLTSDMTGRLNTCTLILAAFLRDPAVVSSLTRLYTPRLRCFLQASRRECTGVLFFSSIAPFTSQTTAHSPCVWQMTAFRRSGIASPREEFCPKKPPRTASWDRAVVFDPRDNSVDIRKKLDVDQDVISGICQVAILPLSSTDVCATGIKYQKLALPKRRKDISLFVEQDKRMKLKTGEQRASNDVFLARLNLDQLGLTNRALLLFGFLSTLYVSTDTK